MTCVIPGTSKPEHMRDNMQAGFGVYPDAAMLQADDPRDRHLEPLLPQIYRRLVNVRCRWHKGFRRDFTIYHPPPFICNLTVFCVLGRFVDLHVAAKAIEEAAAIERQRIGQHRGLDLLELGPRHRIRQRSALVTQADEEGDAVPRRAAPASRASISAQAISSPIIWA